MTFQVWVVGMSVIVLMNKSMLHIFAIAITHILATTWSSFQLQNTHQFRTDFQQTTMPADSCGVNILPNYWSQQNAAKVTGPVLSWNELWVTQPSKQITVLSINVVFLISPIFFAYHLVKVCLTASSAWKQASHSLLLPEIWMANFQTYW